MAKAFGQVSARRARHRYWMQTWLESRHLSVEHLISREPWDSLVIDLPPQDRQQAILQLRKLVQQTYAPPIQHGPDLLQQLRQQTSQLNGLLGTGSYRLDSLLGGGLRAGQWIELVGSSAAGKTQVCHQAALRAASLQQQMIWVDTTASFSPARLASMHATRMQRLQAQQAAGTEPLAIILERILLLQAHDLHALMAILQTQLSSKGLRPALVIIDSAAGLVQPILGAGGTRWQAGHALMVTAAQLIKLTAAELGAVVLTTNYLVGGQEDARPALGDSWRLQPHVRMLLTRPDPLSPQVHCSLHASPTHASGSGVDLILTKAGVEDA